MNSVADLIYVMLKDSLNTRQSMTGEVLSKNCSSKSGRFCY